MTRYTGSHAAPQTSYGYDQPNAFAGMIGDGCKPEILSYVSEETTTDLPFGIMVAQGSAEQGMLAMSSGRKPIGVLVHTHAVNQWAMTQSDGSGVPGSSNATGPGRANVMREGRIWVKVEQIVTVTDAVYFRHTTRTTEQVGAFRKDADSSGGAKAQILLGARWIIGAAADAYALLEFDLTAHLAGLDSSADNAIRTDLASALTNYGGSLVALEDADGNFDTDNVEAALKQLAERRFDTVVNFAAANSAAGKTLMAGVSAKSIYLEGFSILVNGATAWSDSLTMLNIQDDNSSAVVGAQINVAALAGNAVLLPSTTNVVPKLGLATGFTASKNLVMKGDAVANNGSTLKVHIWGRIQ